MDPITRFTEWLDEAKKTSGIAEPTAMTLATTDAAGQPSARVVLLKAFDKRGFVFYTNLESRKSRELAENPKAALCFYWMPLDRQVRAEGRIEPVSAAEADAYFATRARESRIGSWSSKQSSPLADMDTLKRAVAENTEKFKGKDVPRPPFWSGWRLVSETIEFWSQGQHRLHERELYVRKGEGWEMRRLYP